MDPPRPAQLVRAVWWVVRERPTVEIGAVWTLAARANDRAEPRPLDARRGGRHPERRGKAARGALDSDRSEQGQRKDPEDGEDGDGCGVHAHLANRSSCDGSDEMVPNWAATSASTTGGGTLLPIAATWSAFVRGRT